MARKKKPEDHVNHEAWAIPYADLLVLLLAFFVVMYAISAIDQAKYEILSDSLSAAFRNEPTTMDPVQIGDPGLDAAERELQDSDRVGQTVSPAEAKALSEAAASGMEEMQEEMAEEMEPLIDSGLLSVREDRAFIEIEIDTSSLFGSGNATPQEHAEPILRAMGNILQQIPNPVKVEGHTDNVPIDTERFPSNWELSAARAAAVVRMLEEGGVASDRLSAVGFGSRKPVASNDTAEGRERNRRVALIIDKPTPRQIQENPEAFVPENEASGAAEEASETEPEATAEEGDEALFTTPDGSPVRPR
ncbi:MAG: flagellar motor protein MotD [Pseudomonadota bacterium]